MYSNVLYREKFDDIVLDDIYKLLNSFGGFIYLGVNQIGEKINKYKKNDLDNIKNKILLFELSNNVIVRKQYDLILLEIKTSRKCFR